MNRRSIFALSAITVVGVALVPGSSVAQQGSLKQQLVGIWTALSAESAGPNGAKQQFYGAPPDGRPKFKSIDRFSLEATPEELKVAVTGTVATFGTWSVNEADKTLSRRPEASLLPNDEGIEQKFAVTLAGDELKTVTVNSLTGLRTEMLYRRAR